MKGIIRWVGRLGGLLLMVVSLRLNAVQPTDDQCPLLAIFANRVSNSVTVSLDATTRWELPTDGGEIKGNLAAGWLLLDGNGTLQRVRPDGSHRQPLGRNPIFQHSAYFLTWLDDDPLRFWFNTGNSPYRLLEADAQNATVRLLLETEGNVHTWWGNPRYLRITERSAGHQGDWYYLDPTSDALQRLTFSPTTYEDILGVDANRQWLVYSVREGNTTALRRVNFGEERTETLLGTSPSGYFTNTLFALNPIGPYLLVGVPAPELSPPFAKLYRLDVEHGSWHLLDRNAYSLSIFTWLDETTALVYVTSDPAEALRTHTETNSFAFFDTTTGQLEPLATGQWIGTLADDPLTLAYAVREGAITHLYSLTLPSGESRWLGDSTLTVSTINAAPCPATYVVTGFGNADLMVGAATYRVEHVFRFMGWAARQHRQSWHPIGLLSAAALLVGACIRLPRIRRD